MAHPAGETDDAVLRLDFDRLYSPKSFAEYIHSKIHYRNGNKLKSGEFDWSGQGELLFPSECQS